QFRRAHSKTRTGCVVCKIRRVKCDEIKPDCKKCTSTGRKCEGYEKAKPPRGQACNSSTNTSGLYMIVGLPMNTLHSRQLSHIPGHFEPHFWNHIILQSSHSFPAVQHALVAL
ncbi:hypothetical protein L207DRAFT_387679, partial [Hyaloscypha variabilis F]